MSGAQPASIQSTAGAVAVRNEKGEISMKKVKVQRYISGKKPEFAQYQSSEEDSDNDDFVDRRAQRVFANRGDSKYGRHADDDDADESYENDDADDPRLRRLMQARNQSESEDDDRRSDDDNDFDEQDARERRIKRHRREVIEPEILHSDDEEQSGKEDRSDNDVQTERRRFDLDSETESELSDTEIENRRQVLRQRMLRRKEDEEVLAKEEEKKSESEESESSEYEETESEDENDEPRLKPVFVSKRDRATIAEKEKEAQKQKQLEGEAKRLAKERRRQTLRLVEESVKKDLEKAKPETNEASIDDVCTDDENDEVVYEAWKLRELKRVKRDRDEREQTEKERNEIERVRNLTEEERRQEARANPREVLNKAAKGKYKFLQKYYHRGAFYLDKDAQVLQQDFAQATLEDHFDKSILPKVMQVKNFGRCGRTKYTHLVDQDTTQFDSPWTNDSATNSKFYSERGGGMKQVFEKPSGSSRRRRDH